jgi:flagellar biosynthesis protein FlhB
MNEITIIPSNNTSIKFNSTIYYETTIIDQLSKQPTRQVTFIGAILAFVFIFFGLIGNILLITTILSVKKLRSNIINIFIVSVSFRLYSISC